MTDLINLKKIESRSRTIAFIIPLVLICLAFAMFSAGSKLMNSLQTKKSELSAKQQTAIQTLQFNQFLTGNSSKLEQIDYIIPNEAMMIGVIQDLESVMTRFDPQSTVKIASTNPTRVDASLSINLVISLSTPMESLPEVLKKIQQLPYMIQLLSLESNQAGETFYHQLSLRLYVQDPFSQH